MAILRQVQPDVRLLIVGGSSLNGHLADLKQLVERRSLLDCVHFLGIRTDVPSVLDALDVACLSSDREGMPIALMEYMAAGKPIVSTFVGGIPEMVDDRAEALLVPPRDPQALAQALETLIADRDLAVSLGLLQLTLLLWPAAVIIRKRYGRPLFSNRRQTPEGSTSHWSRSGTA